MSDVGPFEASNAVYDKGMAGDRGDELVELASMEDYIAFGEVIQEFRSRRPDVIIRTTGVFSRQTMMGSIRVRWWPRGEEMPR